MTDTHHHTWTTRYATISGVDCASGMVCDCGVLASQDEVERVFNIAYSLSRNATAMLGMADDLKREARS